MLTLLPGHSLAVGISLPGQDSLGDAHWLTAQEIVSGLLEVQLSPGNTPACLPPHKVSLPAPWFCPRLGLLQLEHQPPKQWGPAGSTSHLRCVGWGWGE